MNAESTVVHSELNPKQRLRCLWISRDIPFPQNAGDRIYSANLAQALAGANSQVCFLGYFQSFGVQPAVSVEWLRVQGEKRNALIAALSRKPHIAAVHDTREFNRLLNQQLTQQWDAIIMDGYASGWALSRCIEFKRAAKSGAPLLVYISHNHETSVWRSMAKAVSKLSIKGLMVWLNYFKVRAMERALINNVDVLTTITADDERTYNVDANNRLTPLTTLVLTPGYGGATQLPRGITERTPRHVVMLGSFRWVIKQENLKQLVAAADSVFAAHNIILDVIGDVPDKLRNELSNQTKAIRFHGFVTDPSTYFSRARIAIVPEVVGGGFKLKVLDYVFSHLPVFTLTAALAGVPTELSNCMVSRPDMQSLITAIVKQMDNVETLEALQTRAYQVALPLFRWQDRGDALADLIRSLRRAT